MIRIKDRIKSLVYRLLRSEASNGYNTCSRCKKRRRNLNDVFKKDQLIGYDKILHEWVVFTDYNVYVKTWVMNGYIVRIYSLNEELWNKIKTLCRKCISKALKNIKSQCDDEI